MIFLDKFKVWFINESFLKDCAKRVSNFEMEDNLFLSTQLFEARYRHF